MSLPSRLLAVTAAVALLIPACAFLPDAVKPPAEEIVVTAAPVYAPLAALDGGERFPHGAQLVRLRAGKAQPLLAGFAATADANISFDGERVLFAGKKNAADPWQIWELKLGDGSLRQLFAGPGDAIRPFYLPAGQFVFARRTAAGFQLVAAGKANAASLAPIDADAAATLTPLTYFPGSAVPSGVLADGRILFESDFPLGEGKTPELYLVYSDGSGVESYRCDHGRGRWGGRQLASGDVVFTHGDALGRFTSPLAHEVPVAAPHAAYAGAIAETPAGDWLVSMRTGPAGRYALTLWKHGAATTMRTIYAAAGEDVVDPVPIAPRDRPRRHPSALHPWEYANLLALDARLSRAGDLATLPAAVRLETLDAQGRAVVNGTAPVASDGSFFVKAPGNQPIRFALLDANGAVVRQERGWFWARGGEQRICVGCHTGPERAAENRVPAVLLQSTTPADLTGSKTQARRPSTAAGGQ
jgi:hypothetical protein